MELVLISDNQRYEIKGISYTKKRNIKFKIHRNGHDEEIAAGRFREPINYTRKEIQEISETFELLTSSDMRDRLVGEYIELCIRIDKLQKLLDKYAKNKLDFMLHCPDGLLRQQLGAMIRYKCVLEERIRFEGIKHIAGYYDEYDTEDFKIPF